MKNPLPLLLAALAVAAAASAEPPLRSSSVLTPPADRCDVAWLTQAQNVVTRSGSPADPNKYLTTKTVDGAVYPVIDPAAAPKVCDANVWGLLAGKAPAAALLDAGAKAAWDMGLGEQIKILLAADDLFKTVDSGGAEALAKADAVTAAAAKIEDKGASAADMTAALSALLKDPPAVKGAKPGAPGAGPAVLAYRKAVLGLAAELSAHSSGRAFAEKRGVDAKMKTDFLKASADAAYAAPAKLAAKDGSAEFPDSAASDDGYAAALKFLTEPASPAVSVLAQFDASLRDRLVEKAAAADKAYAAAKARLNGSSVKAALAAVAHDAKAGPKPGGSTGEPAKGSLAADVLERLKATKEYSELNTLYDNKSKSDPAWAGSEEGKKAAAEMAAMRQDAANTAVVKTKKGAVVQYTVGGQKVTDEGIVVADLKTDKEYHDFIASAIASVISSDGKVNAVLAALRGQGAPGTAITQPLTPDQQRAADKLPPGGAKADPAKSAWQTVVAATPNPAWYDFSGKSTMERYREAERAKAAAAAAAESDKRRAAQQSYDAAKAALEKEKAAKAAEINSAATDPAWQPEAAAKWRKTKLEALDGEYAGKVEAARKKALEDSGLPTDAQIAADLKKKQDAADAQVNAAYADGIIEAVGELRTEYRKVDGPRARAAAQASTLGTFYGRHLDLVDNYFKTAWPNKDAATVAACRGRLWGTVPSGRGTRGVFLDPSPDNVDSSCVRAALVQSLKDNLGKVMPSDK